jgi:hypothetical protein
MGGIDLVNSGRNVAGGQGDFFDYLTLALAPTAFAGYGAGQGIKAAANSPALARALALQAVRRPTLQTRQPMSVLEEMARSGDTRFKNIFEMQPETAARYTESPNQSIVSSASIADDMARRTAAEESILGISRNAPGSERPIYGTVTPSIPFLAASAPPLRGAPQSIVQRTRGMLSANNPALNEFGEGGASVVFKPSALDNATVTAGDTGAWAFGGVRGSAGALNTKAAEEAAKNAVFDFKGTSATAPYIEAQMYGADLANASKVLVPNKQAQQALQDLFKQSKIKVPVRVNTGAAKQSRAAKQAALREQLRQARNNERVQQRPGIDWDNDL